MSLHELMSTSQPGRCKKTGKLLGLACQVADFMQAGEQIVPEVQLCQCSQMIQPVCAVNCIALHLKLMHCPAFGLDALSNRA